MGKYETTLKYVQMGKYLDENKYDKALLLAQDIDIEKVKELPDLKLMAEVYIANEEYTKARDIYKTIYNELSTRRILYKLISLCIKSGDIKEAESLYQIYLLKDRSSIDRLILRYEIDKANEADIEALINDLEDIKEVEYIEEWAYELAKQYHKAGFIDECIRECHSINVWFAGGEIAKKAELLKMHYDGDVSDEVIEGFQESISKDISSFINEEMSLEYGNRLSETVSDIPEEDLNEVSEPAAEQIAKENTVVMMEDTADIKTELTENILSGIMKGINTANIDESDIDNAKEELKEDVKENIQAENILPESKETESVSTEEAYARPNVSKYGRELPYTHVKALFKGIASGVDYPINIALAASEPTYYLTIVKKITKELQNIGYMNVPKIKIAKIGAEMLNTLSIDEQVDELLGSCVMIEGASKMNAQTINGIIRILDVYPSQLVIILVDDEEPLSKMLFKEEILKNKIKYFVTV